MNRSIRTLSLVMAAALVLLVTACASPIKEVEGKSAYTQVGLWSDRGKHLTTNYSRGQFIPVNTRVEITDTSGDAIIFRVADSGETVAMANAAKHTRKDIKEIYDRYFGSSQVNLSRFDAQTRESIESGKVKRGMSKNEVLLARGYPPGHETPSTNEDVWKYWKSRFDTVEVIFENDKVSRIKD